MLFEVCVIRKRMFSALGFREYANKTFRALLVTALPKDFVFLLGVSACGFFIIGNEFIFLAIGLTSIYLLVGRKIFQILSRN